MTDEKKKPKYRYTRPPERFTPPENYPNRMVVPENTILAIAHAPQFENAHEETILPLKNQPKRDWFTQHAYFCLPLTFGNQHGFAVRALYGFRARWNGGDDQRDLAVEITDPWDVETAKQYIFSHFGMGVVTVQNRFSLRTPKVSTSW